MWRRPWRAIDSVEGSSQEAWTKSPIYRRSDTLGSQPRVLTDLRNVEGQKTVWNTVFPTHAVQAFDGIGGADDFSESKRQLFTLSRDSSAFCAGTMDSSENTQTQLPGVEYPIPESDAT